MKKSEENKFTARIILNITKVFTEKLLKSPLPLMVGSILNEAHTMNSV